MASNVLFDVVAAAKITASGTGITFQRGCACARTAAGITTVTLDKGVDAAECLMVVTPRTAALNTLIVDTSDTVKTITAETDAGVDTDCDMDILVVRCTGGAGR